MNARGDKPNGPRGSLLLGSTLDFKSSPLEYVRYVSRAYGDVAHFKVAMQDWYLLTHPDDIWSVMTEQKDVFLKPKIARKLWTQFLGNGLLTAEGDDWRRMHLMMKPGMHTTRLRGYADTVVAYTHRAIDKWSDGERRDISRDMTELTLEIVCKTLFDADVSGDARAVGEAMTVLQKVILDAIYMPIPLPRWWPSEGNRSKVKAVDGIRAIVGRVIAERRASGEDRGDLLSEFVFARTEEGKGLSDQEIYDNAVTLFFAGHETSANALSWCWYLLSRNPQVVEKLRAEVDAVLGDRPATFDDLKALPYTEMVVKESLRRLCPVWVYMKEPIQDAIVGGYRIPKGGQVMISPGVTHMDERFWPNPEAFIPERFAHENIHKIPKGAYIPFSGGSRVCFGKSFAMMELRLVVATFAQRLDFGGVPADHRPEMLAELSMHPKGGLPFDVVLRPRNKVA